MAVSSAGHTDWTNPSIASNARPFYVQQRRHVDWFFAHHATHEDVAPYRAFDQIQRDFPLEVDERDARVQFERLAAKARAWKDRDPRVVEQRLAQFDVGRDPAIGERVAMAVKAREQIEPTRWNLDVDLHRLELSGHPAANDLQRLAALFLVRCQFDTATDNTHQVSVFPSSTQSKGHWVKPYSGTNARRAACWMGDATDVYVSDAMTSMFLRSHARLDGNNQKPVRQPPAPHHLLSPPETIVPSG